MRASPSNTIARLVFFLWPVPWILGTADRFAGTWPSYAAYAAAGALVIAALLTAWSAYRRRS
jgi:hypothetical protein